MGKNPKTTQTNTYAQLPITQQQQQLQSMVVQPDDPSVEYNYGARREDLHNSWMNPLGAYTTSAVRDAADRVANEQLSMAQNVDTQAARANNAQNAFNRQAQVAGMTAPVQTGGTSVHNPGWGSALWSGIGAAANMGSAAL